MIFLYVTLNGLTKRIDLEPTQVKTDNKMVSVQSSIIAIIKNYVPLGPQYIKTYYSNSLQFVTKNEEIIKHKFLTPPTSPLKTNSEMNPEKNSGFINCRLICDSQIFKYSAISKQDYGHQTSIFRSKSWTT